MSTDVVTADGRARVLADGNEIPLVGLGVWQVENDREGVDAVRWALKLGYRHIDTAQAYGNEESVGQGLRESGVPREEVFITTKFFPARKDPVAEVERSLQRLGVDYVDLYIVHWPAGRPDLGVARDGAGAGARLCALDRGLQLRRRRAAAGARDRDGPAGGQSGAVQSLRVPQGSARVVPRERDCAGGLQPAGNRPSSRSETVARIAQRHGRTPAQVLLRWCIERGIPVIPKSTHRERIAENAQLFDFALSEEDIAALDALDRTGGTDRALEHKWWRS